MGASTIATMLDGRYPAVILPTSTPVRIPVAVGHEDHWRSVNRHSFLFWPWEILHPRSALECAVVTTIATTRQASGHNRSDAADENACVNSGGCWTAGPSPSPQPPFPTCYGSCSGNDNCYHTASKWAQPCSDAADGYACANSGGCWTRGSSAL